MKRTIGKTPLPALEVWCEWCCIRIAPNEERVEKNGKSYHVRCGRKLSGPDGKGAAKA